MLTIKFGTVIASFFLYIDTVGHRMVTGIAAKPFFTKDQLFVQLTR